MKELKFLILLFYYSRPKLVKNALQSLLDSTYRNYELVFIDDSEDQSAGTEAYNWWWDNNIKKGDPIHGRYLHTQDTLEEKTKRGASNFGFYANYAMKQSWADICFLLCDDDFIYPTYMEHLNRYYQKNPTVMYSYGHIVLFDPLTEKYENVIKRKEASPYLNWQHPINPFCQVDSSQVSFRLQEAKAAGIEFIYPRTENLDADLYAKLHNKFGPCIWNGGIAQYKGWHSKQLGRTHSYNEVE